MASRFPGQPWNGCTECGCPDFRQEDEVSIGLADGTLRMTAPEGPPDPSPAAASAGLVADALEMAELWLEQEVGDPAADQKGLNDVLTAVRAARAASAGEGALREAYQRGWSDGAGARDPDTDPQLLAMKRRHSEHWWKASHEERIADMLEYATAKAAIAGNEAALSLVATLSAARAALAPAQREGK